MPTRRPHACRLDITDRPDFAEKTSLRPLPSRAAPRATCRTSVPTGQRAEAGGFEPPVPCGTLAFKVQRRSAVGCSRAGQRSGVVRARPTRRYRVVVSVDVTPAPPVPRAAACPLTGWQRGSMVARATTVDARQDHASADRSGSCRSGAADGLNVWRTGGTAMPLSATGLRFATARALVLPCGRPIVMNAVIVMDFMTL